jgi:hypothetical protein|mmetsp:Transcript_52166/g.153956  ORF Transcript_52166/g.153956 Transcript_52166/m.153956 type:complete len:595 (-) Transcript_52166:85-1869(-)
MDTTMGGFGMDESARSQRPVFGGEAERIGTRLDAATDEFLKETKSCRALQIPPGQAQLTAMEFVTYLGIDLTLEPELAWIAREMLAAPMPPNAKMKVSQSGVCYFHDTVNDYYTIEHPLTQRYLKVLERQRLDLLCLRTKPSVDGLLFKQPDMLFQKQFRNLQIPCQSCGVMQSTLKCNQCMMSFCQACADTLHKNSLGPRKHHTFVQTACGSLCSNCSVKKPQLFCPKYDDYFCFNCFSDIEGKGNKKPPKAMLVNVSDGDIIEPQKRCEECQDNPAAFACDYCLDNFCVQCFWKCHFNGHRRQHTASKVCVTPLCNQCQSIRATIFCEQTQELMCTECFTMVHHKGNRMLHLFMDAMDLLVLLERLDPAFQEHMRRARPRVLWALSSLQGWVKGIDARRNFRQRRDVACMIQRRWRGVQTRRKLLGMLHLHKWRRRQVNTYFLPKTMEERRTVQQKCAAMLAAKDVTQRAANASLRELKDTILQTASADPLEDVANTKKRLEDMELTMGATGMGSTMGGGRSGQQSLTAGPDVFKSYEDNTRFSRGAITGPISGGAAASAGGTGGADLATRDIRKQRDTQLRQITGLNGPGS